MLNKLFSKSSFITIILLSVILSACQGNNRSWHNLSKEDRYNTKYKGHFKVGNKYSIKGKIYKPEKYKKYSKVGVASWYADHGTRYCR